MCRLEQITEQPALQKRRTGCFDSIGCYLADGFICCAFFHARMALRWRPAHGGRICPDAHCCAASSARFQLPTVQPAARSVSFGVDIGISGFGSRNRLSGILPEHFGQFDASFRDGGTLGQMMDQPQLGAQLVQPPTSSAPPMIVTAVLMAGSTGASSIVGALGISIVEAVTATRFLGIVKVKLSLFL